METGKAEMRYVLGCVCVLALGALPLSVRAQEAEEATTAGPNAEDEDETSSPNAEEPAPSSEAAPEEPALELKLDEAGVEVTPSPPRTFLGYTLEELELRKRRAALGLIAPAALTIAGVTTLVLGRHGACRTEGLVVNQRCNWLRGSGIALTTAGSVGMIVGLGVLGARKRALSWAEKPYIADTYRLKIRVKRARRWLISTSVILGVGVVLLVAGAVDSALNPPPPDESLEIPNGLLVAGAMVSGAGSAGMLVSGAMLGDGKRKLRRLREADYGRPRRVQWDLARSRLVF
jgi:hypothetical protein